ncbi:nuclear ribonucleoprotein 1 [Castilleja foliolosa]|uniref:Nuclear ribonucleoprotein 1 n=1 Tax=Castilleja foliolosa TaxID=1961234 RepID=A0ABD3CCC0_9LAMI
MDSDQGKLFIGGISWETNEEKLKEYFQGYGEVVQAVVMRDKISGKPRGFGFVVFSDPDNLDRVLQDKHVIDGRTVEAKRALSREEQQGSRVGNPDGSRNFGGGGGNNTRTKKIFVGGLPPTLSEDGFRSYFETYGVVTDVVIMFDQQTNRPRGFGFISFDSEDAVDRVLHKTFHDLSGKQVEVKRALPKDANSGGGGRSMGGGGYQGGGNSNSFDSRMESNRYMQSQNSGGYPSYASSGYNSPGYGYGPTNNAMGYGYGNYGGASAGFGGPVGGGYGNPNAPNAAGYGVAPNAQRNPWGSQAAAGYGYGGSQWGTVGGGAPGAVSGGAGTGQSPSGASGYGSQGYGYSGYGGNEGGYGNQAAAYGAVGGRAGTGPNGGAADQAGSGYMGGGYGDASGGGNAGWRSDASQPSGNYGGGYGGGSARQ